MTIAGRATSCSSAGGEGTVGRGLAVRLGVVGGDVDAAVGAARHASLEARQRRDRVAEVDSGLWLTVKTNSPSGPDETPTDWTPATRPRWRLKLAMLATLTRPTTTTWVCAALPAAPLPLAGHEAGEPGGERVVADLRDLLVARRLGAGERLGLGGVVVRRQAERREARIALGLALALVVAHDLDRDVRDGLRAGCRVGGDLGAGGGLGRGLDRRERGLAVDLAVAVDAFAVAREALVGAGLAGGRGLVAVRGDGLALADGVGRGVRLGLAGPGGGLDALVCRLDRAGLGDRVRLGDGLGLTDRVSDP